MQIPAPGSERANKEVASKAGGRREFETRCSRCHGLDGRGGKHGPNISTSGPAQQRSDDEMLKIIHDGIPAKGMPAFDYLRGGEIKSMVRYLRSLGGQRGAEPVKGNYLRGELLFFGKAECGNCHMMRGKGGFPASDLTEYAKTHAPGAIQEAILRPSNFRDHDSETAEIVTRGGERLVGAIRNEDNFSLQLLGVDGAFYLVMKSEIKHLNRNAGGIMPTDYGQRLSAGELEDLVSFLREATRPPGRKSAGTIRNRNPRATAVRDP